MPNKYNSDWDLTGKKIKDRYPYLLQVQNNSPWDGLGWLQENLNVTSSFAISCSYTNVIQSITSSFASNSLSTSYVRGSDVDGIVATASFVLPQNTTAVISSNGTSSVLILPYNTYNGVFLNYVITNGVNFRAGQITVVYTTSSVSMDETSTTDIGDTSGISLMSDISASMLRILAANVTNNQYNLKYSYNVL